MAWILNGTIINTPTYVIINNTRYPQTIFKKWSHEELASLGIYAFRDDGYDKRYYTSTGHSDELVDGTMVRSHTTVKRYSNTELRQIITDTVNRKIKRLYMNAKSELEYLNEFDSSDTTSATNWSDYIALLKSAREAIKSDIQDISSYTDAIDYINGGFGSMLPSEPGR